MIANLGMILSSVVAPAISIGMGASQTKRGNAMMKKANSMEANIAMEDPMQRAFMESDLRRARNMRAGMSRMMGYQRSQNAGFLATALRNLSNAGGGVGSMMRLLRTAGGNIASAGAQLEGQAFQLESRAQANRGDTVDYQRFRQHSPVDMARAQGAELVTRGNQNVMGGLGMLLTNDYGSMIPNNNA